MITQCPKTGRTCEVTGCAGCWKDSTTQDEIIRMAREAGFEGLIEKAWGIEQLERFAALVAAHERENLTAELINEAQREVQRSVFAEREACEKVCKDIANSQFKSGETETAGVLDHCAAAIRVRGEE